jgi:hypothetical protein
MMDNIHGLDEYGVAYLYFLTIPFCHFPFLFLTGFLMISNGAWCCKYGLLTFFSYLWLDFHCLLQAVCKRSKRQIDTSILR